MPLFQATVVTKYLHMQDTAALQKKWQLFREHFHNPAIQQNIRNSKEEQYQGEFLIDLFVTVLGYTKNPTPQFNLTTEYKNVKDSKKADGAIIFNDAVKAVIELKGTETTDLAKVETQAFGYKNNQPKCKYVITSNFEKIRFYIDNATEHIEFNLFTLEQKSFELLYLCLAKENVEKDIPQKIKNESLSKEGEVTKQLYRDYSLFKRELHKSLVALNPQFDALTLFKKSQKLLDRFLFLFFAEDRALLPPNSVRLVLSDWKELQERDVDVALYERFKKYFGYLNNGFKGKRYDVYPYNGGLFKPDAVLDTITIDDTLLYNHTLKLSEYNFVSEVDVNILGHIFENSLTEIEEVEAELTGKQTEKTKSKRKKDGVFYTPKYITKYIVANTVGALCEQKKAEFDITDEHYRPAKQRSRKRLENLQAYRDWLLKITICDPACGSGAFLNQALEFLIAEHRYIDELSAKYNNDAFVLSEVENSILENNLFGVDINEESVEIAKLSLWLRTAQKNRKLNDLSNNIKCGNSLIDDPEFAGDKAFVWEKEFETVFANGGFDVVIGNPPYVRQELFAQYIESLKKYKVYSGKGDLYTYFYEKGYEILKKNGYLSFITSGKFFEANYGRCLVEFLIEKFKVDRIIDFYDLDVFEGISAYPLIFTGVKQISQDYTFDYSFVPNSFTTSLEGIMDNLSFEKIYSKDFTQNDFKFLNEKESSLFKKLNSNSFYLKDFGCSPLVGIKTGFNEGFITKLPESKFIKPYIFGKNIKKYAPLQSEINIVFPYSHQQKLYELIEPNDNQTIFEAILPKKEKLEKRAIIKDGIKNGSKKWYEYQQINRSLNFDNEYIIYPNISLGPNFTLSKNKVIDMTGFIIPSNDSYLLAILNSKICNFVMQKIAIKRRGGYQEYKTQYLEKIPFKKINVDLRTKFKKKVSLIISLNEDFLNVIDKFIRNIERNFEIEKLTKKLENWHELTYGDFIKELKKKKVVLSLTQQAEWEDYFLQEQQKANAIKTQIDTLDAEIDALVYTLYGLTEEEIGIIEAN